MKQAFSALVCGYGIPVDILTDRSYHAYLVGVTNWLFEHYKDAAGRIVVDGGPTDIAPPFKRTEAGEMARWFTKRLADIKAWTGTILPWKVIPRSKSLSSVENLMNFKPLAVGELIIFCEFTRVSRIRKLAKGVFGKRPIKVVPIDFNGSPLRYCPMRDKKEEAAFLRFELKAIHDPATFRILRRSMKEKLAIMRQYDREEAHRRLPEIFKKLQAKYRF